MPDICKTTRTSPTVTRRPGAARPLPETKPEKHVPAPQPLPEGGPVPPDEVLRRTKPKKRPDE